MGFKQAAALGTTSFFLGVLFICFNVDQAVLWGPLNDEVVDKGFQFYKTFYNAPPAIKALLHGMMATGLGGLLFKLFKWDESAMFFDGASLGAYLFGIVVYLSVTIPSLRAIATPVPEVDTREVQVEALRVLSAGNIIVIGSLALVLVLQAGQEWARRVDEFQRKEDAAAEAKEKTQ